MCVNPGRQLVRKWADRPPEYVNVACRRCWACLKNHCDDLIGRGLLEASFSDWVVALTLTYDDRLIKDVRQKQFVVKGDFQRFMKRIRRSGYKCKYIAAGEYGADKGRSHFHVALIGTGEKPKWPWCQEKEYIDEWPWGFTFADDGRSESPDAATKEAMLRYVAKYAMKSKKAKAEASRAVAEEWVTYSRIPPLGARGVVELARRQAEAKVVPYNLKYTPEGARRGSRYSLKGASEFIYLDALTGFWPEWVKQPKTEWIANAYRRYQRAKADHTFRHLLPTERAVLMALDVRETVDVELTVHQRMRNAYAEYDRKQRFLAEERAIADGKEATDWRLYRGWPYSEKGPSFADLKSAAKGRKDSGAERGQSDIETRPT